MEKYDKLQLFRCFVCLNFKPIDQANQVLIKGLILPKDVCRDCLDRALEKGVAKEKKEEVKEDKQLTEKEIEMMGEGK